MVWLLHLGLYLLFLFLPHTWIGLWLIYTIVRSFVNSVYITVTRQHISSRVGPLPLCCARSKQPIVSIANFKELRCKRHVKHGSENRQHVSYDVHTVDETNNGCKEMIMSGLSHPEEALFIQQEIENFLGICDVQEVVAEIV